MAYNYLGNCPIPSSAMPKMLKKLLLPIGHSPNQSVEVALRLENNKTTPNYEFVQMMMAVIPEKEPDPLPLLSNASNGVVYYSTPMIDIKGSLNILNPSIAGFDYIIASWGDGSFYSFDLADKVWMALGLSPRCIGNDAQKIIYDDLNGPELDVVSGVISCEYYYKQSRNVKWVMSNDYLRRYLWLRGARGVRVFFYETDMDRSSDLLNLMNEKSCAQLKHDDGWCEIKIIELGGRLRLQIWASVTAVSCDLCRQESVDELQWPGIDGVMTRDRANASTDYRVNSVFLKDEFLERYEQNAIFDCLPYKLGERWLYSPSYKGQWSIGELLRIGRNIINIPIRELYNGVPDREILHAFKYALDPQEIDLLDLNEEHIASKVHRLVEELLSVGENLSELGQIVNITAVRLRNEV